MDEARFREVEKGLTNVRSKAAYEAGQSAMWRKHFDKRIDTLPDEISEKVLSSLPCEIHSERMKSIKTAIGALWAVVLLLISFICFSGG